MIRDFDNWNNLKKKLDSSNGPSFREREIWWCSIGVNIGNEEYGKGKLFNRPVLIFRKFTKNIFLGIPLTSKIKENDFYYIIDFNNQKSCAMLLQMKVLDSKRLNNKMGKITQKEFKKLQEFAKKMIMPGLS